MFYIWFISVVFNTRGIQFCAGLCKIVTKYMQMMRNSYSFNAMCRDKNNKRYVLE